MILGEITPATLDRLLLEAREKLVHVTVDSRGGDVISALGFVRAVKSERLEGNLKFEVRSSCSAASFILLSLHASRHLRPGGTVTVHGGRIEAETNEVVGAYYEKAKEFYGELCTLISPIVGPKRMDVFLATNRLELTSEECRLAGIEPCDT